MEQGNGYIQLKQSGYAKKILDKAGLLDCNSTKIPMHPKDVISKDDGGMPVDPTHFKSLIGGLIEVSGSHQARHSILCRHCK